MPRTEIEILGAKTVTVTERITVVLDVPQEALDGNLQEWAEKQLQDSSTELSKEVNNEMNIVQEDETEGYDIVEVNDFGPHD